LSYQFYRSGTSRHLLHILGSDLEGDIPGGSIKKTKRILPVLESRFRLSEETLLSTTTFGDLSELYGNRSQQFGVENSLSSGPWLVSFSARYTSFNQNGEYREWPVQAALTREFGKRSGFKLKTGVTAVRNEGTAIEPGGRLSLLFPQTGRVKTVLELASVARMPTLSARHYVLDTGSYRYQGNPALLPERVWSATLSLEREQERFSGRLTFRSELRTDAQVNTSNLPVNTTLNAGQASLFSAQGGLNWKLHPDWTLRSDGLFSWSRLDSSGLPFPDLPHFGFGGGAEWRMSDELRVETDLRYMGESTAFDGSVHPSYFLLDPGLRWLIDRDIELRAGVTNLMDSRAEMVRGFPLPGRLYRASVSAGF
jgi:hypothetical protein